MPNIPPPPDIPRVPDASSPEFDPPPGQSKKAKARRKRLAVVPTQERIFLKAPPNTVLIPDDDERRWQAPSDVPQPAQTETPTEEAAAAADAAEDATEHPQPPSIAPEVAAYNRRYQRVQDCLDNGVELDRAQRKLAAQQLRAIENGRREALAIEYAYPRENNATRATEPAFFKMPNGGPESDDAVPAKLSTDSVADLSYTSMVATTFNISPKAAEVMVHLAAPLHKNFPRTLQMLEDGDTSYRHVQILVDCGWSVPEEHMPEYEDILLPFAKILTPQQFARKAKAVADTYKNDPIEERHQEALQRRSFSVRPCDDGMADVVVYMDAAGAYAIQNRIRATTRNIFRKDGGRTRAQVQADIASELLLTGTTEEAGTPTIDQLNLTKTETKGVVFREVPDDETDGDAADVGPVLGTGKVGTGLAAGILAKVAIHVPALTLLEKGNEPAYLENYGPISLETALLLAGNAPGFTGILTDPDTGATLSVGTRLYKVPASMRCFLLFRDRTCRFPGCDMPAQYCDIDHTEDWQDGGETKVTNLVTLCRKHHMLKHNTGWNYSMDIDADLTWVSPSGRETPTHPANHIPVKTSGGTVVPDVGSKKDPESATSLSDTDGIQDVGDGNDGTELPF